MRKFREKSSLLLNLTRPRAVDEKNEEHALKKISNKSTPQDFCNSNCSSDCEDYSGSEDEAFYSDEYMLSKLSPIGSRKSMSFSLSTPPDSFVRRNSKIFHVDLHQLQSPIAGSDIRAYLSSFPTSDSFEKQNSGNIDVCCDTEPDDQQNTKTLTDMLLEFTDC